jgi:malate dehydrogenase (quinone)
MKRFVFIILSLSLIACSKNAPPPQKSVDVVLVGGGVMSATLGTFLKELQPSLSIEIYERLDTVAAESSGPWNNAGTGHSAFCELNYTPEKGDGSIDTKKAIEINESFEVSKEFWAYQVLKKVLPEPREFINNVPHMSFVWGEDNVRYLKKRHQALLKEPLFRGMEYSEDREKLKQWIPLVMDGRDPQQKVAATRMEIGTDVNFGTLTRELILSLLKDPKVHLQLRHEVSDLIRNPDATWTVVTQDLERKSTQSIQAKFVFIGAGGGALKLLQKSGIFEAKGYGGVPVGGEWLVTINPTLIAQHQAKVYGKASVGSPPMSVPHLDTRMIDGKKALLFGPFATFSTKFLKNGSWWDMPRSLSFDNLFPMIRAGLDNIPLTRYLISQLLLEDDERLATLREYFPRAKKEDWKLEIAGQRVQIVKKDEKNGGILQFGTEVVSSEDGSLAALLGASPGASTAVPIMLSLIEKCFKTQIQTSAWQTQLKEIIPSYGQKLNSSVELANRIRKASSTALGLKFMTVE